MRKSRLISKILERIFLRNTALVTVNSDYQLGLDGFFSMLRIFFYQEYWNLTKKNVPLPKIWERALFLYSLLPVFCLLEPLLA